MDEFNTLVQALLLKKEQECGKLSDISSRITQENILYINGICKDIGAICIAIGVPIQSKNLHRNLRCVKAYKYLALNTNFKCLGLLAQDNANNHLVDICPLLSLQLFAEILWHLQYDELLAESILYMPIDLVVEIIEMTRRCIYMIHFERAVKLITNLIINSFTKLISIEINGGQSADITVNVNSLAFNIQEMLCLFQTAPFVRIEEVMDNEKYARKGIILKNILDIIITCFKNSKEKINLPPEWEKHYKVTFGHEPIKKCDDQQLKEHFETISKEMMSLLLRKIKDIDCNCYIGWVDFDDTENPSITLQKAIGSRCYNLMELIEKDECLKENEHLLSCLRQISSKPDPISKIITLSLEELIKGANDGNMECKTELFRRCNDWNEEDFDEIKKNKFTIDDKICLMLLDYIIFLKENKRKASFRQKVYSYTMCKMINLDSTLLLKIILKFILKYDGRNVLEQTNTESCFMKFINRNPNFSIEKEFKEALIFMLKNVNKYMRLYLKAFLGDPMFKNTMLQVEYFIHFAPFMTIKDNESYYLVLAALRDIFIHDLVCYSPQLIDKMLIIIKFSTCIKYHDIINMFFTPYLLHNSYPQKNLGFILRKLNDMWVNTKSLQVDLFNFFQGIAKKLSYARKDTIDLRSNNCRIILEIKEFVKKCDLYLHPEEKRSILRVVEPFLEPLDRCYFINTCFKWLNLYADESIIHDYERRFFCAKYKIMSNKVIPDNLKACIMDFGLLVEDILRHGILHSNSNECYFDGASIMDVIWRSIDSPSPISVYSQFCRITMEACQLSLEYPLDFAVNTFPGLIEFFIKGLRANFTISSREGCLMFVKYVTNIDESISGTPYASMHTDMVVQLNNVLANEESNDVSLNNLLQIMEQFLRDCSEVSESSARYTFSKTHSPIVARLRHAYYIVNACMMITNTEIIDCLLQAQQCLSASK